jgi:DNA-binding NtrC family response regulator
MKEKIFVVDDEPWILELLELTLEPVGYQLETFTDPAKAIGRIWENPEKPDLVLTDLDLGKGYNGLGIIESARQRWGQDTAVAIMSGGFKAASEDDCMRATPHIIAKPFEPTQILEFVKGIIAKSKREKVAA